MASQTRWARKGKKKRWIEVEFEGGEDDDIAVSSVAIAFRRGHRRIAFFDVSGYFHSFSTVIAVQSRGVVTSLL